MEKENSIRDTVILGSGCAGLTAAIYAGRANLTPLVIEGHEPGGQLSLTTLVENFPGFPEGIQGPDLIENMRKQATRFGAEFMAGHLAKADLTQRPFVLDFGSGKVVRSRTLIIASGASKMAGASQRTSVDRPRSIFLRDLRWFLLQRQADYRDRWRRFSHGRGAVPYTFRHQGYTHPSP